MAELFGLVQGNADGDADLAGKHLDISEGLFGSLADAVTSADSIASDTLSELFDEVTNGIYLGNISPMQIDNEYKALVSRNGYSIGDALLVLWDKYPTMRPYIVEKYEFLTKPTYTFEE